MWRDFRMKRIFSGAGESLRDYFSDLEIEKVIPQLLGYFRDSTKSQNVVWILADEMARLKDAADKGKAPETTQTLLQPVRCQALQEMDEIKICEILAKFSVNGMRSEYLEIEGQTVGLLPVVTVGHDDPAAYIMLVGIPGAKPEATLLDAARDLSFMVKHLGFSLQHWRSQLMAFHDELSGLYNQSFLVNVLENEIERSHRQAKKFSVLFMDVDYFKSINDSKGHWVGSRVLAEMGRLFRKATRRSDYAFRYGGDEFVIVLPNTDSANAVVVAERLRNLIESSDFLIDGVHLKVTLSIGLATFPDHAKNYKDIIKMADEAMYCGKHKSRNTVFVAS